MARGPGPRGVRIALAVCAALYFVALLRHPPQVPGLHAAGFFSESTCLFPSAATFAIEYRLDAWSCARHRWEPLDPRTDFPIEADDKESRFQRFGHFYQTSHAAMIALDEWIVARHADTIGGIRMYKWTHALPTATADTVARYVYQPLAEVPKDERKDLYWTKQSKRRARCGP